MTDLHPYDGVERRFSHVDADASAGQDLVARLLGVSPPKGTLYDLIFYSGGIGVLDRLAISMEADGEMWHKIREHLRLRTPAEARLDPAWGPDFDEWLDSDPAGFLNAERRPFQQECAVHSEIYFQHMSDVNCWIAVWGSCPGKLNYLAFQQG